MQVFKLSKFPVGHQFRLREGCGPDDERTMHWRFNDVVLTGQDLEVVNTPPGRRTEPGVVWVQALGPAGEARIVPFSAAFRVTP